MTQGLNTNLQTILSQARTTCTSMFGAGSAGAVSPQYVNSIFSLIDEGEQAISGGDNQKAQAITNMVQNILGMITGFCNEKAKATQDVDKNSKKVDNIDAKSEKSAKETKQVADEALQTVDASKETIQNALDDLKALAGEDGNGGELAIQKEKLQKALDEIEVQKNIVNDSTSSVEAKQAALAKIKGLSGEIAGLVSDITTIQKAIDSLNGIISKNAKSIEDAGEKAATVVQDGVNKLQNYVQQASQEAVVNTTDAAKGTAEEVAGADLTATGTSTSFIPFFGQTASAKAIEIGTQLIEGGGIRIKGAASNISKITTALGKMSAEAGEFQGALGNVVGSMTQANTLIGQYGSVLEPAIKAVGSWTQVADGNATLGEEIQKAEAKLNGEQQESSNSNDQQSQKPSQVSQNSSQEKTKKGFEQQGNNIFNFDKKQFGI